MRNTLSFIPNLDVPLTQDQFLLRQLWDAIKHVTELDDGDLEYIDKEEPLHTVGAVTYWYEEAISVSESVTNLVAAFNALRGRVELVFQSAEHYASVVEQERQAALEQQLRDEQAGRDILDGEEESEVEGE